MILDANEMEKKARLAFDDFCKAMKKATGSEFDKKDVPVFRNVFINGYMKALDDLVQMGKQNTN